MGRVLLLSLLLVGSGAAAQTSGAPLASKHLRPPPIEGVAKRLPKAFDLAPALRYDENTDCRAYVVRIAVQTSQPPAKPDERIDGCFIMRRDTADPFGRPAQPDPDRRI